jgi:hypothetical protein
MGLIVALFWISGAFRSSFIEKKAEDLSLREQSLGEVEVGGSALRLMLTGSRGFVICALWKWADEAQKKNRWNEQELYVKLLTRLQPHFISPWLFHSWNLAYNVSVEADQVKDKYYYVSRGTALLAEGERQNHNYPDLRFHCGLYQQHKICRSDETNVFRGLWQMSCMRPSDRDPRRFYQVDALGRKNLNRDVFETFCKEHSQFVRRLCDKLHYTRPAEVVQFLEDNNNIPSLFEEGKDTPLPPTSLTRFPVLPPPQRDEKELSYYSMDRFTDEFDGFAAARAWYSYALEPLPPMDPDLPGQPLEITDRVRQHLPKMTVAIFRDFPPRAQSYVAERLAEEGWFDAEGWTIPEWFDREVRVGTGRNWAADAWGEAFRMWERTGRESFLYLTPIEESNKRQLADTYLKPLGLTSGSRPPDMPNLDPGDPRYQGYRAAKYMFSYDTYRRMTNFAAHYHRAEVEREKEVIQARKTFFRAEQLRLQGRYLEALEQYESDSGLTGWRQILERYSDFCNDIMVQEESYELQLKYTNLLQDVRGRLVKGTFGAVQNCLASATAVPAPGPLWTALLYLVKEKDLPAPELQPEANRRFDIPNKDGKTLVTASAMQSVVTRERVTRRFPIRSTSTGQQK